MKKELYEAIKSKHKQTAILDYAVEVFGDHLADREEYKEHQGIDAVHYYICLKFGYLPRDVRNMSFDDLRFLLGEEMYGWTLPK